jgi:hypothetical protein
VSALETYKGKKREKLEEASTIQIEQLNVNYGNATFEVIMEMAYMIFMYSTIRLH